MKTKQTKIRFRVWDSKKKEYVKGWQQLHDHYDIGLMNNPDDETDFAICFYDEPDSYLKFEDIRTE